MTAESHFSFSCPQCSKQLRAPVDASGRNGKCNQCGARVEIPARKAQAIRRELPASDKPKPKPKRVASKPSPANSNQAAGTEIDPSSLFSEGSAELKTLDFSAAIDEAESLGKAQSAKIQKGRFSQAELEAAFKQRMPRRPVAVTYRLHLMLVAVAMATLPVAYLALLAGCGFGLYFYVTEILPNLMTNMRLGRLAIIYVAAIVSPAIAGGVTLLFLIKPLFFRIASDGRRRSLTRKGEPLLFEFVDQICHAVGAPKPKRIDVDYQVNASAHAVGGLWGAATGNMVLTIGIPLLAGLSLQQMAGVLAHEFGHFTQRVGMGATMLIRRINWWFTRVVYQRDALDEMLEAAIQDSDYRIGLVLQLAQVFVFASRGVLWCFMVVSNAISCGLLRQMEFDADRYEYGLVGSKVFAETSRELRVLGEVQAQAVGQLFELYQRAQMADDMILLNEWTRQALTAAELQAIDQAIQEEKTSLLASHPCDLSRIAKANQAGTDGIIQLHRPARDLVRHYKSLCKNVTWDFYSDQLGARIAPTALTPTEELVSSQA